nr:DNA helicase B [Pogona vitticeps]
MAQQPGRAGGRRPFELWGSLLPLKREGAAAKEEEEDDDEDDDDPEPLDITSEDSGQGVRPRRKAVVIKELNTEKEYEVVGRFPFVDPWWKVNIKVKRSGSKYFMQGYPSYYLQIDTEENQKAIISLLFKACTVPDPFRDEFFKWLPEGSSLNLTNLEEKLEEFKESKCREKQRSADTKIFDIFYYIKYSDAGKAVLAALSYPIILEFLPKLLPRNVFACIEWFEYNTVKCEGDRLTRLDKILKEEPWKLGFNPIMYREFGVYLAEAPLKNLCECKHLFQKIPELQKNALIVYEKLKQSCRNDGHTYEEQDELTRMVSKKMSVDQAWKALRFMKDEEIVIMEKERVFPAILYKFEKQIADVVCHLTENPPWHLHVDVKKIFNGGSSINKTRDSEVESKINDEVLFCEMDQKESSNTWNENCSSDLDSEEETEREESTCKAEADPDQESAVQLVCSNPVTIISGKGGCGKTTVISSLFHYLMQTEKEEVANACNDFEADLDASEEWNTFRHSSNLNRNDSINVLFTAPTGKAAALLSKKTKQAAYTLHQVIYSYYGWRESNGKSPWKFSTVNVLVVDEGSLVPVGVLSRALEYLFYSARLTKLVILGDVRQLPSIEPGNMLADIFESVKSRGWCIELKTNHRAESQLIVDNATRIFQRRYPEFDEVLRISEESKIWPVASSEKKFILILLPPGDGSNYLQSAITALLEKGPGLKNPRQSQFITFRRKECDIINEICCRHYSHHPMRDHKNKLQFLCGDKICSTKNVYLEDLLPKQKSVCTKNDKGPEDCILEGSEDSDPCVSPVCIRRAFCCGKKTRSPPDDDRRLCNGEIFFIKEDKKRDDERILTINITDGPEYTVLYQALRRNSKIKHAWARTIHTFQGSEEKTVVYVVGNSGRQNWQHVYTAVTRGRSRVYIVAEEAKLQAAVARKSFRRKTYLCKHMKEVLVGKINSSQQSSSPQMTQQNQENNTGDSGSPTRNNFTNEEESVLPCQMECDHEPGRTNEEAGTSGATALTPSEHKRRSEFPDDCSSPLKVTLVTEDNKTSPLATNLLRRMTLKSPASKQLFYS